MSDRPLVVLKFGSSVLRSKGHLPVVAEEIKRHVDGGLSVVAVVSAIGKSTESLIKQARSLGHDADKGPTGQARGTAAPVDSALAALLGTGEAASAALVGLALHRIGVGDIGDERQGTAAGAFDLVRDFLAQILGRARVDDQRRTGPSQLQRRSPADIPRAAGDDRYLAREFVYKLNHDSLPLLQMRSINPARPRLVVHAPGYGLARFHVAAEAIRKLGWNRGGGQGLLRL